jgi:hypothetical protein
MPKIFFLAFLFVTANSIAQSPAGVGTTCSWIKDERVEQVNSLMTASAKDVARSKLLNYNNGLSWNNTHYFPIKADWLSQATIYTVYRQYNNAVNQAIWKLSGASGSVRLSTQDINASGDTISFNSQQATTATINTYIRYWKENEKLPDGQRQLSLGIPEDNLSALQGEIAEFILYDRVLKLSEQRKIESYLAIKYGVTLQHDYISSDGSLRWSFKNNGNYGHQIIGIGRDDASGLYQKQSVYQSDSMLIAIGAEKIAGSNDENAATFQDQNFLLLGTNNKELSTTGENKNTKDIAVLQREWLMNVTGGSAHDVATELKFGIEKIFPANFSAGNYYLVIDRSGEGSFLPAHTEYVRADRIGNQEVFFKNIYWDKDRSGKDVFTIGIKALTDAPLTIAKENGIILLYPNPSSTGDYRMSVQLENPGSIQISIFDQSGHLIKTMSRNHQSNYLINGRITGAAGVYTFLIQTPDAKVAKRLVIQ